MPALSYLKQNIEKYDFENKILQGIKIHTIRRYRKRSFKINDDLYHYNQQRSPKGHKICENKCLYIADIQIFFGLWNVFCVNVNKQELNITKIMELARNDGFYKSTDFKDFFIKSGLPFYGQIIGWSKDIKYE